MGLYKLFSYNVEVQYKSGLLSKAMFFTLITTVLNVILPFFIAYKSRGFWLRSHSYFEQPTVHFTYEYRLIADSDDPSRPIICGASGSHSNMLSTNEENCVDFQVQEYDYNNDGKNDILDFKMYINVPDNEIRSLIFIIMLDFQLKTVCPLQMQSFAVINQDFVTASSGLKSYADLQFYQTSHLPCTQNYIDTRYNHSLFDLPKVNNNNLIDHILGNHFMRDVTTITKTIYSRSQNGHTGSMDIQLCLRVPEMKILYTPSLTQELKWAWPQYLSLVIIFYWILNKLKMFVFNHRLIMAWEIIPWKNKKI